MTLFHNCKEDNRLRYAFDDQLIDHLVILDHTEEVNLKDGKYP